MGMGSVYSIMRMTGNRTFIVAEVGACEDAVQSEATSPHYLTHPLR